MKLEVTLEELLNILSEIDLSEENINPKEFIDEIINCLGKFNKDKDGDEKINILNNNPSEKIRYHFAFFLVDFIECFQNYVYKKEIGSKSDKSLMQSQVYQATMDCIYLKKNFNVNNFVDSNSGFKVCDYIMINYSSACLMRDSNITAKDYIDSLVMKFRQAKIRLRFIDEIKKIIETKNFDIQKKITHRHFFSNRNSAINIDSNGQLSKDVPYEVSDIYKCICLGSRLYVTNEDSFGNKINIVSEKLNSMIESNPSTLIKKFCHDLSHRIENLNDTIGSPMLPISQGVKSAKK